MIDSFFEGRGDVESYYFCKSFAILGISEKQKVKLISRGIKNSVQGWLISNDGTSSREKLVGKILGRGLASF